MSRKEVVGDDEQEVGEEGGGGSVGSGWWVKARSGWLRRGEVDEWKADGG